MAGILNLILVGALYFTTNRRRATMAFASWWTNRDSHQMVCHGL